ncbi:MAG TPA: biliverdin-producing heme oxygenase [Cytophagaceae bacterium]|jgi:heme oxygenase
MILDRLKNDTVYNHKLLESNVLLSTLMTDQLTVDIYKKILSKFFTYFLPIEEKITPFLQDNAFIPDFTRRRKAILLTDDLHHYKIAENTLEFCQLLPEIKNVSQAMGALYVLEGSSLGGRFISKKVNETIGATPEGGAKFYHGYGAETGSYWKKFCEYLLSYASNVSDQSEIVETANSTFLKLNSWLDHKN